MNYNTCHYCLNASWNVETVCDLSGLAVADDYTCENFQKISGSCETCLYFGIGKYTRHPGITCVLDESPEPSDPPCYFYDKKPVTRERKDSHGSISV